MKLLMPYCVKRKNAEARRYGLAVSRFLMQALALLGTEIERLEVDVTAPSLCDAATDPNKACTRLEECRIRLVELQVRL